jgi:hypothetical protein
MRAAFDFAAAPASWSRGSIARSSAPESAVKKTSVRTVVTRFRMFI